jgi:Glycosyl hydrolase family 71
MSNLSSIVLLLEPIVLILGFSDWLNAAQPLNPLPFNMPASSTLAASPRKVFAHYYPVFPISADNKPTGDDAYTAQFLNPQGRAGKNAAYGGWIRERPLPRAVDSSPDWKLHDMETEVSRASRAGLDGFAFDILSVSGKSFNDVYWSRLKLLVQAANAVNSNFKIMLRPHGPTLVRGDASIAETLAGAIAGIANDPGIFHLSDGRLVVSPWAPEMQGAAWWSDWINIMRSKYSIDVALVPCFVHDSAGNIAAFAPFSYGFSNWGNRTPSDQTGAHDLAALINNVHAQSKIWMQPVSSQDERPASRVFWEAGNTENFRDTWNAAITDGADWVQLPTWNDYTEGAEISPSTHIGWGFLDLASYYLVRYKTGEWPAIIRDTIYVSHRVQFANALPEESGGETQLMKLVGNTPARDNVEVLCFLTATSTIEANIGGMVQHVVAPPGVSAQLFPLAAGKVSAQVVRDGRTIVSVVSPFEVQAEFPIQDEQYRIVSSGRNGSTDSN